VLAFIQVSARFFLWLRKLPSFSLRITEIRSLLKIFPKTETRESAAPACVRESEREREREREYVIKKYQLLNEQKFSRQFNFLFFCHTGNPTPSSFGQPTSFTYQPTPTALINGMLTYQPTPGNFIVPTPTREPTMVRL